MAVLRDPQDPTGYMGIYLNKHPNQVVALRAPTTNDRRYKIGSQWVNKSANNTYVLTSVVAGSANWEPTGGATLFVQTITGDTGGALSPTAGNINILGTAAQGLSFSGSGSTLTGTISNSSETQKGVIEIATDAEAQAKTATDKGLVASNLAALGASDTFAGLIEIATDAEAQAKTATDKALVPSNLAALGASDTFAGLIEIATDAEALAETETDKALVPSNLAALGATSTFAGLIEIATDGEAQGRAAADRAIVPSNLGASGFVQWVDVTLSNSEIKNLRATPIQVVAAPAAGSMIMLLGAVLKLNYGGNNVFTEAGDNLALRYTDGSGVIVSQTIETTGWIDQSADTLTNALPKIDAIAAATGAEAQALMIHNVGGAEIAGNAANDNTVTLRVYYTVQAL